MDRHAFVFELFRRRVRGFLRVEGSNRASTDGDLPFSTHTGELDYGSWRGSACVELDDDSVDSVFDLVVPAQDKLPARYLCVGGPLDGRPPNREWGSEPLESFWYGITRAGGKLVDDTYVVVKPKPREK